MMHTIENATFRYGDYSFKVDRLSYSVHRVPDPPPGTYGCTIGEVTVVFEPIPRAAFVRLLGSRSVQCTLCGQGRLYSNYDRAWKALSRWSRHVCPRGTRGRWILWSPR